MIASWNFITRSFITHSLIESLTRSLAHSVLGGRSHFWLTFFAALQSSFLSYGMFAFYVYRNYLQISVMYVDVVILCSVFLFNVLVIDHAKLPFSASFLILRYRIIPGRSSTYETQQTSTGRQHSRLWCLGSYESSIPNNNIPYHAVP